MRVITMAVAAGVLASSIVAPAEARHAVRHAPPPQVSEQAMSERYYDDPFYGYQGGQVCRRWCPEDRQPCDPVYFKMADGRCSPGKWWN